MDCAAILEPVGARDFWRGCFDGAGRPHQLDRPPLAGWCTSACTGQGQGQGLGADTTTTTTPSRGRRIAMRKVLCAFLMMGLLGGTALAAKAPETPLSDPQLESRAQALAREIRCVVCENEPVALSSAEIAVDMRAAIRTRVAAGDSDAQVRRFFAQRYGEFVLLRPRIGPETWVLWAAPFVLLVIGGGALLLAARRARTGAALAPETHADDAAALAAIEALTRDNKARSDLTPL